MENSVGDIADSIFVIFLIATILIGVFFGPIVAWYYRRHPRKKTEKDERKQR